MQSDTRARPKMRTIVEHSPAELCVMITEMERTSQSSLLLNNPIAAYNALPAFVPGEG